MPNTNTWDNKVTFTWKTQADKPGSIYVSFWQFNLKKKKLTIFRLKKNLENSSQLQKFVKFLIQPDLNWTKKWILFVLENPIIANFCTIWHFYFKRIHPQWSKNRRELYGLSRSPERAILCFPYFRSFNKSQSLVSFWAALFTNLH